jgi:GH18 family chitinase
MTLKSRTLKPSISITQSHHHHHSIVCFYHSNINVSLLNANICTHIVYTSLGTDADGNIIFPFVDDMQVLSELNFLEKMRKNHDKLKLLISVGDKGESQRRSFNSMLGTSHSRKNFARNIVGFCRRVNFDGIDLSWQKPMAQHSKAFSDLLRRVKELLSGAFAFDTVMPAGFDVFRFGDKAEPAILSATLSSSACHSYDVKTIGRKVKFINLMNFDMHAPGDEHFGVDHAVATWLARGVQLSKVNLGIATYSGCNDTRSVADRAGYARYGGLHGVAIHAFDGDDYTMGFPLIRAAMDVFDRDK